MANTEELLDAIGGMTVLELSEFVKAFEDKFGVTAAAPVAVAGPAGPAAAAAEPEEEKDEFDVVLTAAEAIPAEATTAPDPAPAAGTEA